MSASATGKRYRDLPGVTLSEMNIPLALRPLLADAAEWAIVGDAALERLVRRTDKQRMRSSVEAARPLFDEIYTFAFEGAGAKEVPVPDEVVVFQMFWTSLQRMETEIR